jgi:hypothetical protein
MMKKIVMPLRNMARSHRVSDGYEVCLLAQQQTLSLQNTQQDAEDSNATARGGYQIKTATTTSKPIFFNNHTSSVHRPSNFNIHHCFR